MNDFQYKGDVNPIGDNRLRIDSASHEPANPVIAAYVVSGAIARYIGQYPGKYTLLFASAAHVEEFKEKITTLIDDLNQNGAELIIEFK
jgi:hypothetical protein